MVGPSVVPDWASLPIFGRRDWGRLPFGAFADSVNERVEPADAAEEIYVGLEHLDPGSLHILRWGKGTDVIGTKLRFRQGDVIFGRRRAYQRKLAVAEMDGICSAHAMVVRAKPELVLPEFLPFLMMSDKFMNRAVAISVGSLSPTINWTTLKQEEFHLPPLDQQQRIADVLWAVDESLQCCQATSLAASKARTSLLADFTAAHGCDMAPLGECLEEIQYGSSSRATLQRTPGLVPILRIPNVIHGRVDFGDLAWLQPTEEFEKYRLVEGDVLIVRTNGNPDYVGRTAVYDGSGFAACLFASYLIRLRPERGKLSSRFLHEILQADSVTTNIRKQVKSSAGNYNLNTEGIRGLRIPLPKREAQEQLLERLGSLHAVVDAATQHTGTLRALCSALVNNLFAVDGSS